MDTTPAFPTLRVASHPLVQHKLSILRDRATPTKIFKELVDEIATLIAYEATSELSLEPAPVENDRNKYVAAALAFFLGTLGIHRFYLGRTGTGILMVVLSCTIVGLIVTGLWAFIDAVRYLIMPEREFANRYRRDD